MENQSPASAGVKPFIEPAEPKTLSKDQYKQARAAAAAEVNPLTLQSKLEGDISKEEAGTSATKPDEAGTELKA